MLFLTFTAAVLHVREAENSSCGAPVSMITTLSSSIIYTVIRSDPHCSQNKERCGLSEPSSSWLFVIGCRIISYSQQRFGEVR